MEPTTVIGGQRSELRSKSPLKQNDTYKTPNQDSYSPLRYQKQPNEIRDFQRAEDDEEQRYEERRGEELRRQIREREAELKQITSNKDRLKLRIQNSLSFGAGAQSSSSTFKPALLLRNSNKNNSPLRQVVLNVTSSQIAMKQSDQIQNRNKTSEIAEPDSTTKRVTPRTFQLKPETLSSQADIHNFQNSLSRTTSVAMNQNSNVQNEYMQQLYNDNSQLQRRLNLVVAELDRVTRDINTYRQQLNTYENQNDHYQRAIDDESRDDAIAMEIHEEIFKQREDNQIVQFRLQEFDASKSETLHSLNLMQADRERQVCNSENLSFGLTQKLQIMKDIEHQQKINKEKIEQVQVQIRTVEFEIKNQHKSVPEMQQKLEKLRRECDDLFFKLEQLNETYDHAVNELSRERAQIQSHHKRHTKLIAGKAMFQSIDRMIKVRKQLSMNEFFNYCRFDKDCHRILKQFSNVLDSCGKYQMKIGLKKFFQNTLKPLDTCSQSGIIIESMQRKKLKSKMFRLWSQNFSAAQSCHKNKLAAINLIWRFKVKDVKMEVDRAFKIWRDTTKYTLQQLKTIKFLVNRQESNKLKFAFTLWHNNHIELEFAIRNYVLANQQATNQMSLIALNQLKCRVRQHKRIRLMKLAHLFKAWKDCNAYRKLMMSANLTASHMRKNLNLRLKSACFQALRLNKETEKFELMQQSLNGNYEPALNQLEESIRLRSALALTHKKLRCLTSLQKQANCRVASYFHHWKMVQVGAETRIKKNLKEIVIRYCTNSTHKAFNLWLNGLNFSKRSAQTETISHLVQQSKKLSKEVDSTTKDVKAELQRQQKNARSALACASEICVRRFLTFGLRNWHLRCRQLTQMEQGGAGVFIQKMRKSLCKQAFKLYKEKIAVMRQEERSEARCSHYLQTRTMRLQRTIYNALCQYNAKFRQSKKNFTVLIQNIQVWIKQRTIKRWRDQGNTKAIQLSRHIQNINTSKFDDLNVNLGQVVKTHSDAVTRNTSASRNLIVQGNRVLSNYFARFYYVKAERGVKKWCEFVKFQKHRESVIKHTINHWRKHKFYFMKAAFQNWIAQCKNEQLKLNIKQTVIRTEEAVQINKYKREQHETFICERNLNVDESERNETGLSTKIQKILEIFIRKNDINCYQGQLRHIFTQWAQFTKRQVKFINSVTNTISKSLWQNGFSNISAFARDKHQTRIQNRGALGMKRMYWKKRCQAALNKWRHNQFNQTVSYTENITNQQNAAENQHSKFFDKTQNWTGVKGVNFMRKVKLTNLFCAWQNVAKWQKAARTKQIKFQDSNAMLLASCALKKWHNRVQVTKKVIDQIMKFKLWKRMMIMKAVFKSLQKRNKDFKNFCQKLANIAAKFDNRMKLSSIQIIKDFVNSKMSSNEQRKMVSASNLASLLNQMYFIRMTQNLNFLRQKVQIKKTRDSVIGTLFGHWYSRGLRLHFFKWKQQTNKESTIENVNEQGPVVEDVLYQQMRLKNCKLFLEDQGYTKDEIRKISNFAIGRARELLQKSIARLRHYTKSNDAYLKPLIFDRWRMFVMQRKLIGSLLRNMENKLQPVKVDLSVAFNRWKSSKQFRLNGIDRCNLAAKCANDERHKEQLNQLEDQANQFMNQMAIQRDELVDNYMKGQRMVIALAKNNQERGMQRAISQMRDHAHDKKKYNYELVLQQKINLIQSLKDRIQDFESDNQSLAEENEELRQFSLDGYQIAKNVQSLSYERESLSVDLADKSQTIQKLLDQNQDLSLRLKQAQEHAIMLINQSNYNMRRLQQASAQRR